MNLHLQSVVLFGTLLIILMFIYIVVLWLSNRKYREIGTFLLALLFLLLGNGLLGTQGVLPSILSIVVSNILILIGLFCFLLSFHQYQNITLTKWKLYLSIAVFAVVFIEQIIFGIVFDHIIIRSITTSIASILFFLFTLNSLKRFFRQKNIPGIFLFVLFSILLITIVIRIPELLMNNNLSNLLDTEGVDLFIIIASEIIIVSIPIGFSLLIADKLRIEAKKMANEKGVLLQELHHRTRNNMNVIISMLNLQSAIINSNENYYGKRILDILTTISSRIQSMAIVHSKLHNSEELDQIDFPDYIRSLLENIRYSFPEKGKSVKIISDIKQYNVHIDKAIPLGLILNELVMNSYKHAVVDIGNVEITIKVEINDNRMILEVSDNGKKNKQNIEDHQNGLGMNLIKVLAEDQLMGSLEIDQTEGYSCKVVFPLTNMIETNN